MNDPRELLPAPVVEAFSRIDARLAYWHPTVIEALLQQGRDALLGDIAAATRMRGVLEAAPYEAEYFEELASEGLAKKVAKLIPGLFVDHGMLGFEPELQAKLGALEALHSALFEKITIAQLEGMDRESPAAAYQAAYAVLRTHPKVPHIGPLPDTPFFRSVAASLPELADEAEQLWVLARCRWIGDAAPQLDWFERASVMGSLPATQMLAFWYQKHGGDREGIAARLATLGDPHEAAQHAERLRSHASTRASSLSWFVLAARCLGHPSADGYGTRIASESLFKSLALHAAGFATLTREQRQELLALLVHIEKIAAFDGAVKPFGIRTTAALVEQIRAEP